MKMRLISLWDNCLASFWFFPAMLILFAAVLGVVFPFLDETAASRVGKSFWQTNTMDGARTVLSSIAGSMITVAGVVFSMTMVTLSIAASQFGSRVLRTRMKDRTTQVAMGTFLGTSVYCFLVLRTVHEANGVEFVPQLSILLGVALAVASMFVLIYFIHDVAASIQASHIVASLAADMDDSIDRIFPDEMGWGDEELKFVADEYPSLPSDTSARDVASDKDGYFQVVDNKGIMQLAMDYDLLIKLHKRPGDFLIRGNTIAEFWGDGSEADEIAAKINESLVVGKRRTPRQDVNCVVLELAQLSVRALSPGINDPFTTMNGIDRLTAALGRLARKKIPSQYRYDEDGHLRVIADRATFTDVLSAAFNQIRQHAQDSPPVGTRLLEGLENIAGKARRAADRAAILEQAEMVVETFRRAGHMPDDMSVLEEQFQRIKSLLEQEGVETQSDRNGSERSSQSSSQQSAQSGQDREESRQAAKGEVNG